MRRYSLWSELLPLELVRERSTLALLQQYSLELRLACFDDADLDELARTLRAAQAQSVPVALWPMLANAEGRWASAHNGDAFARYVRRLLAELRARECAVSAVMIDIEPPIDVMQRWLDRARSSFRANGSKGAKSVPAIAQRVDGDRALGALFDELTREGVRVGAAMVPTDLLGPIAARSVEWIVGLPNGDVLYDPASAMLYTSMLEGYSRGWISRARARALLQRGAIRALARHQSRAEVSLGVVATGALGDEPVYRSPDELADDVSLVRALGVERIALFDLRGVLARPAPERWLEALTR
ncbi:MAG: hypothetical protein U0269_35865 [Polyangiales bacterium]